MPPPQNHAREFILCTSISTALAGLPVVMEQERTLSPALDGPERSTLAGGEFVREREGEVAEHADVLVLQR